MDKPGTSKGSSKFGLYLLELGNVQVATVMQEDARFRAAINGGNDEKWRSGARGPRRSRTGRDWPRMGWGIVICSFIVSSTALSLLLVVICFGKSQATVRISIMRAP